MQTSLCPYCFHPLERNNVVFRDTVGSIYTDPYLEAYQHARGLPLISASDFAYIEPAHLPETDKIYTMEGNVLTLQSVRNKSGNLVSQRLCPYCHNHLHQNFGVYTNELIAVLGFTGAGKSTYLAALHDELRRCTWINTIHVGGLRTIEDNIATASKLGVDSIKSTTAYLGPFVYDMTSKQLQRGKEIMQTKSVTFYDLPGEDFQKPTEIQNNAAYITHASGWVFLIDAQNLEKTSVVFDGIYNAFLSTGRKFDTPIAVVINKGDLIAGNFKVPAYFEPVCPKNYSDTALDLPRVERNHADILATLVDQNDALKTIYQKLSQICPTQRNRWFICSCVDPQTSLLKSANCLEPFLWLRQERAILSERC